MLIFIKKNVRPPMALTISCLKLITIYTLVDDKQILLCSFIHTIVMKKCTFKVIIKTCFTEKN